MKNFVKHTLAIAICAAALLSSCIKEQEFIRSTTELSVSLTGIEDTRSETQGNLIQDAWIWAYQCSINEPRNTITVTNQVPVGSRYVYGLNSYDNISVHLPLPACSEKDGTPVPQSYLLVAVINTEAFGELNLSANSTWDTVKNATFVQPDTFWDSYPKDNAPEVMPISNWTTLTIEADNTHSDNCYKLNLPVYRAVAKTQLYMSKAGDFDLKVLDAKVVANNGYSNGAVLTASAEQSTGSNSEAIQRGKPSEASTTWWWASPKAITRAEGATDPAVTYQLKNSESGFDPESASIGTFGNTTTPNTGDFTWVASTFLLENDNDAPYGTTGAYDAPQDDGYNLYVKYTVDGQEYEVYTPLGKVVRNHDYQVKATVDAGGQMIFNIVVNEWLVEEQVLNYQDIATINNNGYIYWYDLPNIDDYHTWNYTNATGQVVDNPDYADDGINHKGEVNLTSAGGTTAKFKFMLDTPVGGTWIAELRPVGGMANSIVFDNGSSTMTGDINNSVNELVIKNRADNLASAGGVTNIVELHISAKGSWGGEERSYRVIGIAGNGFAEDFNYKIIQPAQ